MQHQNLMKNLIYKFLYLLLTLFILTSGFMSVTLGVKLTPPPPLVSYSDGNI